MCVHALPRLKLSYIDTARASRLLQSEDFPVPQKEKIENAYNTWRENGKGVDNYYIDIQSRVSLP